MLSSSNQADVDTRLKLLDCFLQSLNQSFVLIKDKSILKILRQNRLKVYTSGRINFWYKFAVEK